MIVVLDKSDSKGWWQGYRPQLPDIVGQFPSNYVKTLKRKKKKVKK
jgi:hypothetical protein